MTILQKKQEIAKFLYDSGIISFQKESPEEASRELYTITLSKLCSYPTMLKNIAKLFGEVIPQTPFDLIAGPSTDIPLATTLSLQLDLPMIFVRGKRKDHGMEKLIEGIYKSGQKVIVIDDEIADVPNTLQFIGRLEGSGLQVVGVYVLLDRGLGHLEALNQKGYLSDSLLHLNDIFLWLSQSRKLDQKDVELLKRFRTQQKQAFIVNIH